MKGDFTRWSYDPAKHFTRVLKQQGRVDLDADWNELVEIFTQLERTEAIDVIGPCGVPLASNGFYVEPSLDGTDLTFTPGRIYVNGILCTNDATAPVAVTAQPELPGYTLPETDGNYLVYVDVWERHITYVEDPEIREVALGGPDTATRTQVVCQARLAPIPGDTPFDELECQSFVGVDNTGRLEAQTEPEDQPSNPCVLPAGAGYRGLENRLYRVEIHDDGRDEDGVQIRNPTFIWSRDNGSVVLPIADDGIDGADVTVSRFGHDEVLTVRVGDWVEVLGDHTDLNGRAGTLAQVAPDGIDRANREITLTEDVSAHAGEPHPKLRRWDHHATDAVALDDGALPIQADWFELEDGVQIRFDTAATYEVGDYWLIPARTREGTILWPDDGGAPAALSRLGIYHHYCTLALAQLSGGIWVDTNDCRPTFRPLTEIRGGGCCVTVQPGDDVQQAIDTVIGAGGGCVTLCPGVHEVDGPLWIRNADDLKFGGENTSSVLRFNGLDALGRGGLIIERGQRVTIHDLFICSDNVSALVSVLHDEQETLSRQIALHDLTLLNLANSDGETNLACGIRLGHAEGVDIDRCRIAAEVGIVSLWGNELPDLSTLGDGGATPAATDVLTIGFETLPADTELLVGDSIAVAGITITGAAYQWPNGQMFEGGRARVDDRQNAGGAGQDLAVNNINLDFDIAGSFAAAQVTFGSFGGNTNLRVNGQLRNVNNIFSLDGETIGGVEVSVTPRGMAGQGTLTLAADTSPITEFVIGGQELWIDNVVFRGAGEPTGPVWSYGDGVSDLLMGDTAIRYADYGVVVALAERWLVTDCDIQSLDTVAWAAASQALPAVGSNTGYTAVLAALDDVLVTTPEAPSGTAVLAFLWRDSTVDGCRLLGIEGMQVFWWIRGMLTQSTVTATDVGLFAFWLHDADWGQNRVDCAEGTALGFTGSYRARIENNDVSALLGLSTFPFMTGISGLTEIGNALVRGYGQGNSLASFAVLWIFTEESVHLMGLRALMDATQEAFDIPGDVPVTFFLALVILNLLDSQARSGSPLAVINLRVVENRFACRRRCISLKDYLPLGSLRISDNTVHTITGQAIRVEAFRFFANAHLLVFFYRATLALLLRQIEEALDGATGPTADVLGALRDLVISWQAGSEAFLELDLRIEGNSIRSLRTAIDSNLFELAILNNHITLQERSTVRPPQTSTVFGRVTNEEGIGLAGAIVMVTRTDRAVETNQNGEYRIANLPTGSYRLLATRTGFALATRDITLSRDEQLEVNIALEELGFVVGIARVRNRAAFTTAVLAERTPPRVASNTEIAQVIEVLETSEAFEPLGATLREGGHISPVTYSSYLLMADGPLTTDAERRTAAIAASAIRGLTSDEELEQISGELNTALRNNDGTAMAVLVPRFIAALLGYVDSLGILVRGVGCRIVENQVLVPADIDPQTQALGGIQVSVDFFEIAAFVVIGNALMRMMGQLENQPDAITDPLLNITETLIANNEVTGGIGHGVTVQGVMGRPDFVPDLRIRGNQLRGLAGTGVFCNEQALIIGLDIDGNHVTGCGRSVGFTAAKGGIVIRGAAVFAFRHNRVTRCGEAQAGTNVFGVDLDTIYGLQFIGNEVLANGTDQAEVDDGGLQLVEVYGNVSVHDNVFSFNRGSGLSWVNSARIDEPALLPEFMLAAVNLYLRTTRKVGELVQEEQASVQNNVFKTTDSSDLPVFRLLNLNSISFSGNNCLALTSGAPLGEIQRIGRGVIANNQLQTNAEIAIAIKKLGQGVIIGNVGNQPIQVVFSGAVQSDFNIPTVT